MNVKCFFTAVMFVTATALLLSCGGRSSRNNTDSKPEALEISFNYTPQQGPGSNQYAVWIEDADSAVVKTLFVTHFSVLGRSRNGEQAERGYRYREPCVARWIKNVNADSLTDAQLDAVSGATPKEGGLQTFVWDFTDEDGNRVADGMYTAYIQANLHDWSINTYRCTFNVGSNDRRIDREESFMNPDANYEDMITEVSFELN